MIEARHARTPSGSGPVSAQFGRSASTSSSTTAGTPMARAGSLTGGPLQTYDERRPSFLDVSALSPAEHTTFIKWLGNIKPSPSGEPEHIDEQDALRFLRHECAIDMRDEIKILSLFDRFPLGLLPGHFFALLRLAAWVQRGEEPTKAAIFTQVNPPKIGLSSKSIQPPPQHVAASSTASAPLPPPSPPARRRSLKSSPPQQQQQQQQQQQPTPSRSVAPPPTIEVTPGAAEQARKPLQAPLVPVAPSMNQAALPSRPPPVPDETTKPNNPFRSSSQQQHPPAHAGAAPVAATAGTSPSNAMLGSAILGFDPAPNPFKQSKPKLVRPTPIVANASTQVLGRPSPAVNPFKSGASVSSSQGSPVSVRSNNDLPALPPRSTTAADLRPPPPLPPRHISPLIQAGLNARSEVRKKKEALPPKTFTVLQSSGSRHHNEPRLLTGQAAQPPPPPPPHKRRSVGTEHRRSVTDVPPPSAYRGATSGASVASSDRQDREKRPASSNATRTAAVAPSLEAPSKRAGPLPPTIAPKPSYGGKGKSSLPAWLQEQEELQRGSLHEHPAASLGHSVPTHHSPSSGAGAEGTKSKRHHKTAASQRIQFLDNDSDSDSDEISEQARSAASIDRNNPFFPPHARDIERGVDLSEPLSKLAVANAVAAAVRDGPDGQDNRPLGRSKTLRDTYRGGAVAPPPAPPPRRRLDSLPGPATFNAGTYPGFGKSVRVDGPTVGGLRQNPQSKKAEVGIPPEILAEREKAAADKQRHEGPVGQRTPSAPLPPPRRRPSSVSAESGSSAAVATPASTWQDQIGTRSASFSQRMGEILGLSNGEDGSSSTKLDSLRQDFNSVAERHEWLARATERAKGRPLNEARVGLMDETEDYHDAPDVDGVGLQDDPRRASMTTPRAGAPMARRAPSIGRSSGNPLVRRTSLLSRPSVGPFDDEEGDGSALVVDEEEENDDDEDDFHEGDEEEEENDVGPDVDNHSGSSNTKVRESLEEETRRRRRSSSSTRANRVASGDKHTDMAAAPVDGGWQQLS